MQQSDIKAIDGFWRAANYLSVGQIYLLDNPLLREPLARKHIKPRLLGHWGTTPGLNFIYAHMNHQIAARDLDAIFLTGPGHGGPGLVASAWLDGTYSEVYPHVSRDEPGMQRLFRQFSFPGGIPSHVAPETPGSIHEGGELGYVLSHAFGAAFDNPDLIVCAVVGDGEAETGPLATSCTRTSFSTRCMTAPCCRSCTSTATRSPIPPCSPASRKRNSRRCCAVTVTSLTSSVATTPNGCTPPWPRRSTGSSMTSMPSSSEPAEMAPPPAHAGR